MCFFGLWSLLPLLFLLISFTVRALLSLGQCLLLPSFSLIQRSCPYPAQTTWPQSQGAQLHLAQFLLRVDHLNVLHALEVHSVGQVSWHLQHTSPLDSACWLGFVLDPTSLSSFVSTLSPESPTLPTALGLSINPLDW